MQKIKRSVQANAKSDAMFLVLSGAIVICFIAGAIVHSLSWGAKDGLFIMSFGLLLSMFLWTLFFTEPEEE